MTTTAAGTLTLQVNLASDVFVAGIATSSYAVIIYQTSTAARKFRGPEHLSIQDPDRSEHGAGNYGVILANLEPGTESLTYLVTQSACSPQR